MTEAAEQMGLPVGRVERLLEEETDRRTVIQFRQDHVENAPLRQRFLEQRRRDPALTAAEIAHRIGTSPIQVERWLGLRPTAPKIGRRGRTYPGRILSTISVENAGRLARAMGYAPGSSTAADHEQAEHGDAPRCQQRELADAIGRHARGTTCW